MASAAPPWQRLRRGEVVVVWALVAALARFPYLRAGLTPDEAGFLTVARQWHPGTSLYGNYWVDRPPLLIALFWVGDHLGGTVGLRLLGCFAAACTVLAVGAASQVVSGPRAGRWGAAVACAALGTPLTGSIPVDGELLAAPFVAGGVLLVTLGLQRLNTLAAVWLVAAAGAAATAALLVKQNMLDVVVFAVATGWLGLRQGALKRGRLTQLALTFFAGAAAAAALVVLGARANGTSPAGTWFAMYDFRLRAMVAVQHTTLPEHLRTFERLAVLELLTLGPAILVALAVVVQRRRRTGGLDLTVVAPALLALACFDVVSVVAGGSYWMHYLVQLIVPTALGAGILAARAPRLGHGLVAATLCVALGTWFLGLTYRIHEPGPAIGAAIGQVSRPGDTVVSALGDPDIVVGTGLTSPYPYLWSLPARTLDPGFTKLEALLQSRLAPTWLVVRGRMTLTTLLASAPGPSIRNRYHLVSSLCGRDIYLRDDARRGKPSSVIDCSRPLAAQQ